MDIYIARENSDMTEGRGPMRVIGLHTDLDAAMEQIKGRGVMGVGDGEILIAHLDENGSAIEPKQYYGFELYYGYRQGKDGRWGTGFVKES